MTEPRDYNHNNRPSRQRVPVIKGNRNDHNDGDMRIDRQSIASGRSVRTVDDRGHVRQQRSPVLNSDRRSDTMTRITNFYRRDTALNADSQRKSGHRVFRLKGYTTVGKINRKFAQERQQRTLRNILTTLMVILLLIILFVIYNPFKDMSEFRKISGEDSLYKSRTTTTADVDETPNSGVNP
jgi:hypothetical protein